MVVTLVAWVHFQPMDKENAISACWDGSKMPQAKTSALNAQQASTVTAKSQGQVSIIVQSAHKVLFRLLMATLRAYPVPLVCTAMSSAQPQMTTAFLAKLVGIKMSPYLALNVRFARMANINLISPLQLSACSVQKVIANLVTTSPYLATLRQTVFAAACQLLAVFMALQCTLKMVHQ
jgi:hypothetical protein